MADQPPYSDDTLMPMGREIFPASHLKSNLKKRSVRGGLMIVGSQMVRYVINIVAIMVLARWVLPEEHGLVGLVTAITGFILMFKEMGLADATVQRPVITHEQISTLFWFNVLVCFVLSVLTCAMSPVIVWFYDDETRLYGITLVLGATFIFTGLTTQHQALLRRTMQFKRLSIISVGSKLAGAFAGIVMALMGGGYWSIIAIPVGTRIANAALAWMLCPWIPGRPMRNTGAWDMVKFGTNITGTHFSNYWAKHIDNILIGKKWGTTELGYYTNAYKILLLPVQMAQGPIGSVAVSALSRVVDEPKRYRNAFTSIYRKMSMFFLPAVTMALALSDWVIYVALGPNWSASVPVFQGLAAAVLYQPILTTTHWLFITQNRTKEMLRVCIASSVIAIVAISLAVAFGKGIVGVALAYSLSGLLLAMPLEIYVVTRKGPVNAKDYIHGLIPSLVTSAIVFGVCFGLRILLDEMNVYAAFSITACVAVGTTLAVYMLIPRSKHDVLDTINMIKQIRERKAKTIEPVEEGNDDGGE